MHAPWTGRSVGRSRVLALVLVATTALFSRVSVAEACTGQGVLTNTIYYDTIASLVQVVIITGLTSLGQSLNSTFAEVSVTDDQGTLQFDGLEPITGVNLTTLKDSVRQLSIEVQAPPLAGLPSTLEFSASELQLYGSNVRGLLDALSAMATSDGEITNPGAGAVLKQLLFPGQVVCS